MDKFNYFETTADIGIEVVADSLEEAFINSALATMNIVTDVDKIETIKTLEVDLVSEDMYSLLYDWITEVIMLMNCDFFIAGRYELKISQTSDGYKLNAKLYGDTYDTTKYSYKTEVKAITYHLMQIECDEDSYHVKFIVDI
ncbi:MAG: archease [Methanosphaera sp.]|nr:archease [Methanosphaera sp.]